MRYILILCISLFLISCDEVSPKQKKAQTTEEDNNSSSFSGQYTKDGKGGLFNNIKWYYYSLENHFVWPLFDVFAIKTPQRVYHIQFTSYYDAAETAGTFQVRVNSELGDNTVTVEAPGCGNPFTNPNFDVCTNDPDQNVFTYLDLETLQTVQMNDATAQTLTNWDIAFRGTDIKLNSGLSGPSTVVGAVAHRFPFFFESGSTPSNTAVMDASLKQQALQEFDQHTQDTVASYYLPDGIDRVIHETFWFTTGADGLRSAQDNNWWLVQSYDSAYFAKIRALSLVDQQVDSTLVDSGYTTTLTFEWELQARDQTSFAENTQTISIDLSTTNKTVSLCINLENNTSAKCASSDPKWDIKIVSANTLKNGTWAREWRIFTSNGALGPKSKPDMDLIETGHAQQ